MSKLRVPFQDLLYAAMGLVSFAYFVTHKQVFVASIALLFTVLYVVKSVRLNKRRAAELEDEGAEQE